VPKLLSWHIYSSCYVSLGWIWARGFQLPQDRTIRPGLRPNTRERAHVSWWKLLKLRSKDPEVRLRTLKTFDLAEAGDSKLTALVIQSLKDENVQVCCEAAKVLGGSKNLAAADSLIPLLWTSSAELRQAAADALGKLRNPESIEPLKRMLRTPNPQDRASAGAALRALGWVPATPEEEALFEVAIGNTRAAALKGEAALEPLVSELHHDTSFARRSAAEALEGVKDPRRIQPLIAAVNDPDPTVQVSAIHALSAEDGPVIINTLVKRLRHPESCVRQAAAEVLAKRNNPELVPHFLGLINDSSFEVRLATVKYLSQFAHPEITQGLLRLLGDKDSDVRLAAVKALGASAEPMAVEGLVLALVDEEQAIRQAAEGALYQINPCWAFSEAAQRAAARLEALLGSAAPWVRSTISQLLTKLREA